MSLFPRVLAHCTSHTGVYEWIKLMIHLDGQSLPVSDHSAELNHRLHLRDCALNALVNQILPEK